MKKTMFYPFNSYNYGAAVGNVSGGSFLEIWRGKAYDKLREAVNDRENMPGPCINCWWVNRC